jgi:hypothetical protein
MATDKQIAANRANARFSTGPKTQAGKAKVRYNAMKHGLLAEAALLPDEDETTFRDFAAKITTDLRPNGEMESILVERIINTLWRLRRLSQVEAGLFVFESAAEAEERWREDARRLEVMPQEWLAEQSVLSSPQPVRILNEEWHQEALVQADQAAAVRRTPLGELGAAFARDAAAGNAFSKLGRYETQLNRTLERTLKQLDQLKQMRASQGGTTS